MMAQVFAKGLPRRHFAPLWIMAHLNHNMIPMDRLMQMQR